jgi:predicted nucleic acid-binding protein
MIFADLQRGDAVFLDANIFIYHFAPDPALGPPCNQLLQRIENQELTGFMKLRMSRLTVVIRCRSRVSRPRETRNWESASSPSLTG